MAGGAAVPKECPGRGFSNRAAAPRQLLQTWSSGDLLGATAHPPAELTHPACPLCCRDTVSVDGKVRATLYPRSKDPTYGWWTEAAGAPPNAPFDEPFYLIL